MKPLYICCHAGTKKPIGFNWGKNGFDTAELAKRQAINPNIVVGMILGQLTGIIDVECDGEAATAEYQQLFGDIKTPSWSSLRGKHHLFQYDSRLADLPSTVKLPSDLEFRIGNDGQTQSVCPPSTVDGVKREWIISLDECDPAPLPEHVVALLLSQPNDNKATTRIETSSEAASAELIGRAIEYVRAAETCLSDGKKNAAFRLAGGLYSFVDEGTGARLSEQQIVDLLRPWNILNLPPLSESVLSEKVRNAMTYSPRPDKVIETDVDLDEVLADIRENDSSYKSFPVHVLPSPVNKYVQAASAAIGCDPSFVALPLLGCLARAVSNKRVIELKPTWHEPAVIWAAVIGESGTHKTPAMQTATRFLQARQMSLIEQHNEAIEEYENEKRIHKARMSAWEKSAKSASVDQPLDAMPPAPEEPSYERFTTTDATMEALAFILSRQDAGLLVIRDELAGWLGGMGEYKGGRGSDLGHWLASWSAQPLIIDRKTSKTLAIKRAAVSIVGGVQPAILRKAIGREHLQDGLCQRLLLAMPPDRVAKWSHSKIDISTELDMAETFDRLLAIETPDEPIVLPLSSDAAVIWRQYYDRHADEMASLDGDLRAAWSKLKAYAARFALVFQVVKGGDEIDAESIQAGIELSDWFAGEARRVYSMFSTSADPFGELIELVAKKGGQITANQLKDSKYGYRRAGAAKAALNELVEAGRGSWKKVSTGGRPSEVFALAP